MKKILGILILCLVCCGFSVNSDEDKKNACESNLMHTNHVH